MRTALSTRGQATMSRVEALAEAQLGLLTRAQCLGLGMTPGAVTWMVHARRWQRVHLMRLRDACGSARLARPR